MNSTYSFILIYLKNIFKIKKIHTHTHQKKPLNSKFVSYIICGSPSSFPHAGMLTKKVGSIMFYIKTHTTIHNFKKLFTLLITNIGSNEPILSCTYMCVRKPFPCWLTLNIAYRRLRHRFFCRLPNLFLCACNLSSTIFAKFFCYLQKKKKRIGDWFVLKLKEHVRIISQIFFYVLWTIVFNVKFGCNFCMNMCNIYT